MPITYLATSQPIVLKSRRGCPGRGRWRERRIPAKLSTPDEQKKGQMDFNGVPEST